MKKNLKKYFLLSLFSFVFLFILSCTVNPFYGVGSAVDMESPTIEITSHQNLDYVSPNFTLSGRAKDNLKVTRVYARELNSGRIWNANLSGDRWTISISLPDGEYEFRVYAMDAAGNSSNRSSAAITLTVDSQTPKAKITLPSLKEKSYLENLDNYDFENIGFFQNDIFQIKGLIEENYRVKSVELQLIDENDKVSYSKKLVSGKPNPSGVTGNVWNWIYTINSKSEIIYPESNGTFVFDKKYYFSVRVITEDMASNISRETLGSICIYQKADLPWSGFSIQNGSIVPAGGTISGNIYDDDAIGKIYMIIKSKGQTPSFGNWDGFTIIDRSQNNQKIYTWSIQAPEISGEYTLFIVAEDINGVKANSFQTLNFIIPDKDAPISVVTSHQDQSIEIGDTNGNFTISGYAYDNSNVSKVKIAWVPKDKSFQTLSLKDTWDTTQSNPKTLSNGIKIWDISSSLGQSIYDPNLSGGKYKRTFSKQFNINNDFKINNETEYADKIFFIYSEDNEGNFTTLKFTLLGDKDQPQISIIEPSSNNRYKKYGIPFTISGTASDNTQVKRISIKHSETQVSKDLTLINGNWSISSSNFTLQVGVQNFEVYAEDIYGNSKINQFYVIIYEDTPKITDITTQNPSGTYKKSDEILILVNFNKPVFVSQSGNPTLILNTQPERVASYQSGSNSNQLIFKYVVQQDDEVLKLDYKDSNAFKLNGATIKDSDGFDAEINLSTPGQKGSISFSKNIKIDAKNPYIVQYTPTNDAMNVNVNSEIVLKFNEVVYRDSGYISIKRVYKRFPVTMTVDERNEFRSKLSGSNLTTFDNSYTLTSIGSTNGVPNTTPMYVLKFEKDSNDPELINIFDSIGYNEIRIPVDSTQISGSGTDTITIRVANGLQKGIHYFVEITQGTFRDSAGNSFSGLIGQSYKFVTGPVATPIIRIKKVTGNGDNQPFKTQYKISCETEGASIYYTSTSSTNATDNPALPSSPIDPTSSSTKYTTSVEIGSDSSIAGHIERIKAIAILTGLTNSQIVEEIAFKTILSVNHGANEPTYTIYFRGSNNAGGPTTAPGFPLAWETNQYTKIKRGKFDSSNGGRYYLVTWEINVQTQYKALRGNIPTDWETSGPTTCGWQAGNNLIVGAGGYKNINWNWAGAGENYNTHTVR